MADTDIDPFSDHDKLDDHSGETIPLTPGGVTGGSTGEPEREQETSLRGTSTEVFKDRVKALYQLKWLTTKRKFILIVIVSYMLFGSSRGTIKFINSTWYTERLYQQFIFWII